MSIAQETFQSKSGAEFLIRPFHSSDAAELAKFLDQVARETAFTNEFAEEPKDPEKLARGLERLANLETSFWVGAWRGNELAAFLGARGVASGHPYFKHIITFDLMVLQKYWGKGLGGRMMEILESECRKRGIRRVEAMAREGNGRALALYKKNGFSVEGRRRGSVLVQGGYCDEFYIAKLL